MGSSSKKSTETKQVTDTKPTFTSPESQKVLSSLTNNYGATTASVGDATGASATKLKSLMDGSNPYANDVVGAMEAQAPRQYEANLNKVRTAGYRGGAGSDYINQAGLAGDFANQLALNKANVLLNSFNTDRGVQLAAANSLGSLGISNQALGLSLLDSLKGQSGVTDGTEKTKSSSMDFGKIGAVAGTIAIAV